MSTLSFILCHYASLCYDLPVIHPVTLTKKGFVNEKQLCKGIIQETARVGRLSGSHGGEKVTLLQNHLKKTLLHVMPILF